MALFVTRYDDTFTVPVPPEAARAMLGEVDRIATNLDDVERVEKLDPHTLHVVMNPLSRGPVTFRGEYRCRYRVGPDGALAWEPAGPGNVRMRGGARFSPAGDGATRVEYHQEIEAEIEMSWLLSTVATPIVSGEMRQRVRKYLDRSRAALGGALQARGS
jgi:carbon monoxide dehydrogenase subunit G